MERFRTNESIARRDIFETEDEERLVAETRELLDSLDEEALRDIFERELRLSGVESPTDTVDARFIPFNEVVVDGKYKGGTSGYFVYRGEIALNAKPIHQSAEGYTILAQQDTVQVLSTLIDERNELEKSVDYPASRPLHKQVFTLKKDFAILKNVYELQARIKALFGSRVMDEDLMRKVFATIRTVHTLTHEELHAISTERGVQSEREEDEVMTRITGRRTSGIKESSYIMKFDSLEIKPSIDVDYNRFTGINEGVTELINRRLAKEYLETVLPKSVLSTDISAFYDLVEIGSYNRERWVAEQLVTLFSAIAEVPTDVVERSLFRSYLNGGDFLPEELIAAVRHDVPELSQERVLQLLLKLQVAISADSFAEGADADINRVFLEFANLLPSAKRDEVKDAFQALFYKYSFSKELQDGVVETE